jgi:DUF2911 family protein
MKNRAFLTLIGAALIAAPALSAQPRGSERGTVTQVVNGTTLTMDFSRPVARGRDNLFGGVLHWGEVWTPGANWATTLEVDRPIRLDGHRVEPGQYSVWIELKDGQPWRFMLNNETELYHDSPFPADGVALAFDVEPQQGAHMEALNWYVHAITSLSATLRMHWGPTYIELDVETDEYTWDPLPAAERASYLGAYTFDTNDPTTGGPLRVTISVMEEDGRIVGRWGRAPISLVPAGSAEFMIGFTRGGSLFDVAEEMTIRIAVSNGQSTGAELLWEGEPFGQGRKTGG